MTNHEIDCLVAEKIMGWTRFIEDTEAGQMNSWDNECGRQSLLPNYSSDIEAAFEVTRRMWKKNFRMEMHTLQHPEYGLVYLVRFRRKKVGGKYQSEDSEKPAEAICLAALKTVGVEVKLDKR